MAGKMPFPPKDKKKKAMPKGKDMPGMKLKGKLPDKGKKVPPFMNPSF